ncbi:MBL fold metallo-hydrolase [Maritimibacter fusiformis]|uniref:MBL fold metallo-hydrolase n=1 Tax=Maritimibacter fusiformis TaxID=2603819 RepID=A0A5D0RJW8_9RHOB|nr:MBL fold metallo-hydrolase [Maritimibacter fusiformis]TYB81075.1 MBL fold metallo-hydrolase [Maritimibacter fusiformis]
MTMRFEQILAEGVAQCSYLLGDTGSGTAAVVDPRPDCDVYIARARALGLVITHVFETHIHADFLSGARELVDRLDGAAELCVSAEGGAEYGFEHRSIRDGDTFRFGDLTLTVRHTPGHTPEHVSFLLHEKGNDAPWGVLSGDAFFVDSVGRPDLLGDEKTDELTEALFRTTQDTFMQMPDGVIVYPCHGAGSDCGPDIGDRMSTTIGYERRHNKYVQITEPDAFKAEMTGDAPPVPTHYPRLKKVNAAGPDILRRLPACAGMTPGRFEALVQDRAIQVLDVRDMLAFGGGFIDGAINIGLQPELSVWAGWLLDPEKPIALVTENDGQVAEAVQLLWRVGFTRFAGYLAGGIGAWRESGRPMAHIRQMTVQELEKAAVCPLDVRKDEEWNDGHIPNARHAFLGQFEDEIDGLARDATYATYCHTGFRASIAASLLHRAGFENVFNVPGSFAAWQAQGYRVVS